MTARRSDEPRLARGARAPARASARPGFTLVEIVVAIAIIIILAAALAPGVLGVLDDERVEKAAETLEELVEAMTQMRFDDNDWPGRLSHVAWPITISDVNICGANYTSGKVSQWAGPYVDRVISPGVGLPIGIGRINDVLVREVVSGNDGYLKMQIDSVQIEDAEALNKLVDADAGGTIGTIRYTTSLVTSEGLLTVFYLRPIRGC